MSYIGVILGLYWDCIGVNIGVILGLYPSKGLGVSVSGFRD